MTSVYEAPAGGAGPCGTLYVVATPIGNLGDLSERAKAILRTVPLVAAEDTRHSGHLVRAAGGTARLVSFNEHNVSRRIPELIAHLRELDLALVSDAGTPAIADPGMRLVDAAHEEGYPVISVPGPSSVTAAVAASGLVSGGFAFLGFAPRSSGERRRTFAAVRPESMALVVFERSSRLAACLADLEAVFPGRRAAICREISKLHEETVRGPLTELSARFASEAVKGEIVIVIEGGTSASPVDAEAALRDAITSGLGQSAAAAELARTLGIARSEAYRMLMERKER